MSVQTQNQFKKKIQIQNMIILALAIIIIVLIAVSGTAAWYIRTKSDSADIILSNPVNIYITEFDEQTSPTGGVYYEHTMVEDILKPYSNRIYPGDRIKLKLGMQLGTSQEASSNAYIRVKINMAFSKISDDPNETDITLESMEAENLIEYENKPNPNVWELVDFNEFATAEDGTKLEPDYWYVYKTTDANGQTTAGIAESEQTIEFINGFIKLSKTQITNEYANHKFHINYKVEAIQVVNVPDPLKYRGYGPWWGFVRGDIEDIL